jgi:hypothetical protein
LAADKAEKLLKLQESMTKSPSDNIKPDSRAFNAVLTVIARSPDPKKATRAKLLLDRMIEEYKKGDKALAPNLRSYNAVLTACAFTNGEPQQLLDTFKVAVAVLNDLRASRSLSPDATSYGLFLKSCGRLMPPSEKREAVVESTFRKCCADGQCGENVLEELSEAASSKLCEKLLGGSIEEGVRIPAEWSNNVKDKRGRRR